MAYLGHFSDVAVLHELHNSQLVPGAGVSGSSPLVGSLLPRVDRSSRSPSRLATPCKAAEANLDQVSTIYEIMVVYLLSLSVRILDYRLVSSQSLRIDSTLTTGLPLPLP